MRRACRRRLCNVCPPVISEGARRRFEGYIEIGKKTARLLAQGQQPSGAGHYVAPSVFVDVSPDDALAKEEIFGPVLSVFRAANLDEALALALDSEFALTGGLYSRNPRSVQRVRQEFRVGNLYVNRRITGAVVAFVEGLAVNLDLGDVVLGKRIEKGLR